MQARGTKVECVVRWYYYLSVEDTVEQINQITDHVLIDLELLVKKRIKSKRQAFLYSRNRLN